VKIHASGIHALINDYALYAICNQLQRGLALLLLPVYTAYFTKGEFGAMEQIYQTVMVLVLVTSLGLPQGLVRGFYLHSESEDDRRKMVGALITFLAPLTLCVGALIFWQYEWIAGILLRGQGRPLWIQLAVAFYFSLILQQLPLQLYKTLKQTKPYVFWSMLTFLLVATGNIYFIVVLGWGLTGMIFANVLGFGGTGILLCGAIHKQICWNFEWRRLAPLFAFGLPMLPAMLCRKILEISDRYMIPYYHNLDELGLYVMGAKIAAILDAVLLVPFLYAWQPFFYSLSNDPKAPHVFARITHYLFLGLCFAFLSIEVAGPWILTFVGHGKFDAAQPVMRWLVLSILFNGIQYCISPGIHICKKLTQELMMMVMAAGLNLLLNWALIPSYKGVGAAVATMVAYFFYLAATFVLSQRYYHVDYPWPRMGNILMQTSIVFCILTQIETVAVKCSVLAIYVFTGPGFDLWRHGEIQQIRFAHPLFSKKL